MSFTKTQAGADLAAIDDVVGRVKQSRIYRVAGAIAMVWGVVPFAIYAARALAAFALFYGFGFFWTRFVGHFDSRELSVFWHTLFLFGYCLAGLWFGVGFLAIGLGLRALIALVYLYAGAQFFWLGVALVSGFGYILCGYWMRRS